MSIELLEASGEYYTGSPPVTGTPCSMSCWFHTYGNTSANTQRLVMVQDLASTGDVLSLYAEVEDPISNSYVAAQHYDGTSSAGTTSTGLVSANTWHHAAGVFTSDSSRSAFIDGGNKATNSDSRTAVSDIDGVNIGGLEFPGAQQELDGRLAEVGIWNVALTDAEIAILGDGYSPLLIRPQSLVFYLPFVGGSTVELIAGTSFTTNGTPTKGVDHPPIIYPGASNVYVPSAAAVYHKYFFKYGNRLIGVNVEQ